MKRRLRQSFQKAILFFLLPLAALAVSSIPTVANFSLGLGLIILISWIGVSLSWRQGGQLLKVALATLALLLVVGSTGWFLSPFFFLLYLLPIYLGFLYTPKEAFGFLASLLLIFSFSVGEVDLAFDIMTLLSLLLAIPLIIYLRRKYLILRQTDKDILILNDDSAIKSVSTIDMLLSNRVTNLGVTLRQPLSFIRQAASAMLDDSALNSKEEHVILTRIHTAATEALDHIRSFEGTTSANQVLTNAKTLVKKPDKRH